MVDRYTLKGKDTEFNPYGTLDVFSVCWLLVASFPVVVAGGGGDDGYCFRRKSIFGFFRRLTPRSH